MPYTTEARPDAAFIANQREIDALLAEWAAEEQPEMKEAA